MKNVFKPVVLVCTFFLTSGCSEMHAADNPQARMETTKGTIIIELYPDKAPETVENFLAYARDGFFDGTIFHRVIPGFVVQGGGFTQDMRQKPTNQPVKNEANNRLENTKGTLSMARTSDPHSATSQFFINLKDNAQLNFSSETPQGWGYCVFAKVVDGMDVVEAIAKVPTGSHGMHQDVPLDPIIVNQVTVVE